MDFIDVLPQPADIIQVLWKVGNNEKYWWTANVLEVSNKTSKDIVGTGIIQYKPGPSVQHHSDYRVQFFKQRYVYHVEGKKREVPYRQNSWRYFSRENSSSKTSSNSDTSTLRTSGQLQVSQNSAKTVAVNQDQQATTTDLGYGIFLERIASLESTVSSLQKQLICIEKKVVPNYNQEDLDLSIDRIQVIRNFKAYFRRSLIRIFGSGTKFTTKHVHKIFRNHSNKEVIIGIQCCLKIFRWIVADLNETFGKRLLLVPSIQSIYYSSRSVPSFHILLGTFSLVCDWLEIRDIHDRSCLFIKSEKKSNVKDDVLRLIGVFHQSETSNECTYHIGSDLSHFKSTTEDNNITVLHRRSMNWDETNCTYIDKASHITDISSIRQQSLSTLELMNQSGLKFSWTRNVDVRKKGLTPDAADIEDMGEMSLHIPVLYLHGLTAHEINRLLEQSVLDKLLISDQTSYPPNA